MQLILEPDLKHQTEPVMYVADVVEATGVTPPTAPHRNPELPYQLDQTAIRHVWGAVNMPEGYTHYMPKPETYYSKPDTPHYSMMDIKMETGTGKTYVYTRTIYELHKRMGFNKFVVAVPTLPIKAGAAEFLGDNAVWHHFADVCGYHAKIELQTVSIPKKKKKGRMSMPPAVGRFFYGNMHEKNKIYVLLLNTQLLTSGKLLTRDDYDRTIGDFHRPVDAIADCKPILIIDEPHRMKREDKSFDMLVRCFRPQLVLRYGATFPEVAIGKGKNKVMKKDYVNLVYDLTACDAFEQNLIKGVAKEHLEMPGGKKAEKKAKILSIEPKASARIELKTGDKQTHTATLHPDESLSAVDDGMDGVSVVGITKKSILLSNGQEKFVGEEFFPDQYSASYQEGMISLALKRHFETERTNFERDGSRIKTLALFFIDNIESWRGAKGDNDGWLHKKFIDLLCAQIKEEMQKDNSPEYATYLQATLDDPEASCAAYFAQDNNDSDAAIAKEVEDILHGKRELLSFKDEKGHPNVRRFLFSKWTLKEGWDNPNVFTICKLRSSGSETSKLQEVGRGLRLPVDEAGNRIKGDNFMLNYIVDFTERDFADKLIAEINGDAVSKVKPIQIRFVDLLKAAEKRGIDRKTFVNNLLDEEWLDIETMTVKPGYINEVLGLYPEINISRAASRIKDRNMPHHDKIGIRKDRFEQLRDLWSELNKKYILYFDKDIDEALAEELPVKIAEDNVFAKLVVDSKRSALDVRERVAKAVETSGAQILLHVRRMAYNDFLKHVSKHTCLPVTMLHKAIVRAVKEHGVVVDHDTLNSDSATRFIQCVADWRTSRLMGVVRYKQANYAARDTQLTNSDGSVKKEVAQAYIGRKREDGVQMPKKYLYDALAYDSDLEREDIMQSDIDEVTVYGKIPAKSICIPTVASSNYSPDFMYVVQRHDGSKEMNVVIETKGYEGKSETSPDEETKIDCAREFFNEMRAKGYNIRFCKQINSMKVKAIIDELIVGA